VAGSRGRGGRSAAALTLFALAFVAIAVAGCDLLLNGAGAGFGEQFPSSSPIVTFTRGTATIAVDGGQPMTLGDLGSESGIETLFGSNVHWSNADGWHLRVNGAGADLGGGFGPSLGGGESGYLTIDRITDGQHWTTYDPTRCIVEIEVADKTGIRGTATCKGLEWYDALGAITAEPKDLDQPKFDAEITFEATP
jgi:hypothetical protein